MRTAYGILIRFIDLGLLLLMAFLATADLAPKIQVPLPHGSGTAATTRAYRIQFDATSAAVRREPAGTALCQVSSLEDLATCLRTLRDAPAPFLLSPMGTATVQRLVQVMDICQLERLLCSVAPMP